MIPGRVDIRERPVEVEEKTRVGDWEADTIIGARYQGALVSLVYRASKLTLSGHVVCKTPRTWGRSCCRCLVAYKEQVLILIADNGKEFARHAEVAAALEVAFYFDTPYHSWERGLSVSAPG